MAVQYLRLADFLLIAEAVTGTPAEALARTDRTVHLAESALAAPAAAYGGQEFYPDIATKAAILCARLVRNHPLLDDNKRVAFLCMVEFLERNGHELAITGSVPKTLWLRLSSRWRLVRPAKPISHRWSWLECAEYHMKPAAALPFPEIR